MKVAVVGAGTAGLYCIIDLLETLPKFVKIDTRAGLGKKKLRQLKQVIKDAINETK